MIDAVRREGCGSTGSVCSGASATRSPGSSGTFAYVQGPGRSLYLSSGYLANLAVLTAFPEAGDVIFSDELQSCEPD